MLAIPYPFLELLVTSNVFKKNAMTTGAAMLVHGLRETRVYPIVIQDNVFENNFAFEFGTSFAIIQYATGYVDSQCHGMF